VPINANLAYKIWSRYQFCRDNGHTQFMRKADRCERFFAGDQWDPRDLQKLRGERRPALTINKILPTIGSVMGEQIKNRAEISFRPRSPQFDETAQALNKVFKQISDQNQLNWLRSQVFDDGVITSRGFLDVRMDYSRSMQGDVKYTNLNPKNVVIDPDGEECDPDTWSEVFTTKWLTADDIAVLYGKDNADLLRLRTESYFPYGYDSITEDRDRFGLTTTPGYSDIVDMGGVQRQLRLIERQYRKLDRQQFFVNPRTGDKRPVPEGWDRDRIALIVKEFGFAVVPQVVRRLRWTVICDCVELHDDWSPYEHFTVVPYFPYFRHGRTIGLVENLLDPQELLNKTTSQELHIVNSSANGGWKVKQGALTNMTLDELEANGARTGLVVEVNGDPDKDIVKIQPNQTPQGLDRMSYKAEEHIKGISNVSDSMVGQDRADVAAKAIQEKKQSGQVTMVKPLDNLGRFDFFLARATLSLVQRFYTDERLVTFTRDELRGQVDAITVNQPSADGTILNDLTVGEYDVVVTSVPVKDTSEDSQFEQAVSLKEMGVMIPDEVLIEASRLQDKKAILQKMAARAQSPEAQEQAQLQLQLVREEVRKVQAEIERIKAQALKDQANAGAIGVKAQKEAATPIEQPQAQADTTHIDEAKAAHEIDLKERQFQHEVQMDHRDAALKEQTAAQDAALKQQQAAQQAEQQRIAALTAQDNEPATTE
jgi:hypothetical protein